jgi:PAS domain S-box-containing protein
MQTFYRRFHGVPHVARAIEIWRDGDRNITGLMEEGARLHAAVSSGASDEAAIEELLDEIHARAARLTFLENEFSTLMGEAARGAQRVLFGLMAVIAFVLLIVAAFFVRSAVRRAVASELSLRQSEEKKQTVLDSMEDGYYELDLEGAITFANTGLCRILGREAHDILGRHVSEFVDSTVLASLLEVLGRVRQTGTPAHSISIEVLRTDGTRRLVEGSSTLIFGADGEPVGFCGVARDVTERRLQEDALRRSEAEYRALFENAPYGIYRSTPDGRMVAVNSALVAMLGYPSAEHLMTLNLGDDVYANRADRERLVDANLDSEMISDVEVEWRRTDGSPMLVRINGRRLRAEESFDGFEIFVEDLTQRRALEMQLRQAQKMQAVGQLTGGIAHDFNNLLTIIASTADLLAEDVGAATPGVRADIQTMRAAADRGAEMVRKLLAFSRRGQLRVSSVEVGSIIADTVAMLRRILPAHIELITDVAPSTPIVRADAGAIEQILLNLATNARDAMPDGGALRIHAGDAMLDEAFCTARGGGRAGAYAVLIVSDSGMGMDAHTREHAFEPFFTTKAPGAGTGLGMSMVYGLVRQHEGFIDLESTPGVGTTVRIYVPASMDTLVPCDDRIAHARPLGNETILLVEDEAAILGTGKRILERHGYRVLTATNGEEALGLVRTHIGAIDLVLSDVVMPRMGGGALHRAVQEAGLSIRFLFTSGYTEREVGGMLDPCLPLVPKPWSVDELVRRVRDVLDAPLVTA